MMENKIEVHFLLFLNIEFIIDSSNKNPKTFFMPGKRLISIWFQEKLYMANLCMPMQKSSYRAIIIPNESGRFH